MVVPAKQTRSNPTKNLRLERAELQKQQGSFRQRRNEQCQKLPGGESTWCSGPLGENQVAAKKIHRIGTPGPGAVVPSWESET